MLTDKLMLQKCELNVNYKSFSAKSLSHFIFQFCLFSHFSFIGLCSIYVNEWKKSTTKENTIFPKLFFHLSSSDIRFPYSVTIKFKLFSNEFPHSNHIIFTIAFCFDWISHFLTISGYRVNQDLSNSN